MNWTTAVPRAHDASPRAHVPDRRDAIAPTRHEEMRRRSGRGFQIGDPVCVPLRPPASTTRPPHAGHRPQSRGVERAHETVGCGHRDVGAAERRRAVEHVHSRFLRVVHGDHRSRAASGRRHEGLRQRRQPRQPRQPRRRPEAVARAGRRHPRARRQLPAQAHVIVVSRQ